MRIILAHPYCWPYVRRGAERYITGLARYLTGRGHDVITISGKPGKRAVEITDGGKRILNAHWWIPLMGKVRITPAHTFVVGMARSMLFLKPDVVHSVGYLSAWTANLFRKRKGYRTVYQLAGPPVPHWFPRIPPDRFMLRHAILHSDECVVNAEFTAKIVRDYCGANVHVLPVPMDLQAFPMKTGRRPTRPTILSVASFDQPGKGIRVLAKAFEIVHRKIPGALLRLSGKMPPNIERGVLDVLPAEVRADIEVLGVGELSDVPRLYREASLTVLPAMWETYGLVLLESWASGTPTVVANHGAPPELVSDPSLGSVFDPLTDGWETMNAQGLAEAILDTLSVAEKEETRHRCRARAAQHAWEIVGPLYEALYDGNEPSL